MSGEPATRVTDQFAHSSALSGVLVGLAIGIAAGAFIVATGGLGAIAVGAAIGVAGGAGLAGQAIGSTIMGPPTGAITTGSPNVMTNNLPQAATVIGIGPCAKESGVPQAVATGAETVLINNMPAARKGEKMTCSAAIISGSPNVLIGGASVQVLPMEPEVPAALSNTLLAMTIGGTLIATGGIAAAYGVGAAAGSLAGGLLGGHFGGMGGQMLAESMGFGATGQAIGGVLGGFAGGMLGGGAGFRGGRAFDSRYAVTSEGLGSNFGNIRITPRNPPPGQPGPWKGPTDYSKIPNPKNVDASTKPTPRQRSEMLKANREHNDGILRDDRTGEVMVESQKSQKGVTPPQNEAQVDHIKPVDKGGTRAQDNLELRTRKNNRDKWNK